MKKLLQNKAPLWPVVWEIRGTFGSSRTTLIALQLGMVTIFQILRRTHSARASTNRQTATPVKLHGGKCHLPGLWGRENPFPITKQLPRVWKEAPLQSVARWSWASVLPGPSVRSQGRCHRALASALLWALGKHEVGKDRVRHTPRRKFLSGSLEKWIGNQRTLQKPRPAEAPGTPIPRRAPHSPLSLVRAAEPGSRASRRWRMPSGERDGASGLGPASSGGRGAGRAERLLSSVRGEAPGLTLLGRGGGEVEGGPVPPARLPASPPVPCVCQFPRERAPRRPGSDPQRAHGPGRRPAEAWLGTWCPWVASS